MNVFSYILQYLIFAKIFVLQDPVYSLYQTLFPGDHFIIGGDIIPHHLPHEHRLGLLTSQTTYLQDIFLPAVKKLKQQHISIYLDLGNDDLAYSRKTLEPYDGDLFHLLHMKRHPLSAAVDVIGYMIVPPTPFQRKDWEKPDSRHAPYAKNNQILS